MVCIRNFGDSALILFWGQLSCIWSFWVALVYLLFFGIFLKALVYLLFFGIFFLQPSHIYVFIFSVDLDTLKCDMQLMLDVLGSDPGEQACEAECHKLLQEGHTLNYGCPLICHGYVDESSKFVLKLAVLKKYRSEKCRKSRKIIYLSIRLRSNIYLLQRKLLLF